MKWGKRTAQTLRARLGALVYFVLQLPPVRYVSRKVIKQLVRFDHYYHGLQRATQRLLLGGITIVLAFSVIVPVVNNVLQGRTYALSEPVSKLVGSVNQNLASKLSFDATTKAYYFNKGAIDTQLNDQQTSPQATATKLMQAQVGGTSKTDKNTYSVKLPVDPSKGTTYYDNNLNLSFTLTPDYSVAFARKTDGRVVYPLPGGAEAVYTPKGNGLKEDLVLDKASSDSLSFSYTLNLPKELEARLVDDGSGNLGIYSADPTLFSNNISYGSGSDQAAVMKARQNSEKNNLVFVIPAPVIKQTGDGDMGAASASFDLSSDGKTLTVNANHLAKLNYPVSIDPTVVVTSTTDFQTGGNDEGDIQYSDDGHQDNSSGQVGRGVVTGGAVGSWSTPTTVTTLGGTLAGQASVVYEGHIYTVGGTNGGSDTNEVQYAPINSDGTIGTWGDANNGNPSFTTGRSNLSAIAYNGYLYIMAGSSTVGATTTSYNDVQYAPFNSNGTLGSWHATTSFTTARTSQAATAYNGYIYIMGGQSTVGGVTTRYNDVQYAALNGNGTVGTWYPTTAFSGGWNFGMVATAYNGYLYLTGGFANGGYLTGAVSIIKISSSGGLTGGWFTGSSLPANLAYGVSFAYEGYLYYLGGYTGGPSGYTSVYFAQINANGSLGNWQTTSSFTTGRMNFSGAAYNGKLYIIGGSGSGGPSSIDMQYASVTPAGAIANLNNTATLGVGKSSTLVASGGKLFNIGGNNNGSGPMYYIEYATINSDGSLGTWVLSGSHLYNNVGLVGAAAFTNNGLLYIAGGSNGSSTINTIQVCAISNITGAGGNCSLTGGTFTGARSGHQIVTYGNYAYMLGGTNGSGAYYNSVLYASLSSPNTWNTTSTFTGTPGIAALGATAYGGYMYIAGGITSGNATANDVEYAQIKSDGTLGSWSTTTSFTTARANLGLGATDGKLYVIEGSSDTAGNSTLGDIQYASIKSDGSIDSTWTSTGGNTTSVTANASMIYNNTLYVVDGYSSGGGGYTTTVQYAPINNGGSGTTYTWVAQGSATMQAGRSNFTPIILNGYIYALGGQYSQADSNGAFGEYATISTTGTIGTWNFVQSPFNNSGAEGELQVSFANPRAFLYNGTIYMSDGWSTYKAVMGSAGSIASWTSVGTKYDGPPPFINNNFYGGFDDGTCHYYAQAFPSSQVLGEYNGYIYASYSGTLSYASFTENSYVPDCTGDMFGNDGGGTFTYAATTEYAPINADGTIGTWQATNLLADPANTNSTPLFYNGYVYQMYSATTMTYAAVNSNGTLGTPSSLQLPLNLTSPTLTAYDGYLYVLGGGAPGTTEGNTVYYASINSNGTLGTWQTPTGTLLNTRNNAASIAYNGYLYVIGGVSKASNSPPYYNSCNTVSSSTTCPDVQYSAVGTIARVGQYSKVLNLGNSLNISANQVTSTNTYGGANSTVTVSSIGAGANGSFGVTTAKANCGQAIQYIKITINFDDSLAVAFGPNPENSSSVQTLTVNYSLTHPAPSIRLRGGAYFDINAQTKQPLDTCSG